MKILKTILALFISLTVTAQAVQDITYFDILLIKLVSLFKHTKNLWMPL